MAKGEELHLPAVFLFCQSGDLPKRQMSLFDFLDDDKDDGGDDEWCTLVIIVMPVGGQLFRSFREIVTVHSRELIMNDMSAYVIL